MQSSCVCVAFLLAGCGVVSPPGASPTPTTSSNQSAEDIIVTRDDSTLPAECSPHQVAELIVRFFDAFNRGDQEQLAGFFGSDFMWYSVTEHSADRAEYRHFVTYNRDELPRYFAQRHEQHEHLRLLKLGVGQGGDPRGLTVGIAYLLTRQADDLKPGFGGPERLAGGKGAINCKEQTIYVWSMGINMVRENEPLPIYAVCPTPTAVTPTSAVIACARGE